MRISRNPGLPDVAALLNSCGLPSDDIVPSYLPDFVLATEGPAPIGVAGLQVFGARALLRSVGVAPDQRSHGLGTKLVAATEARAKERGVTQLYLLTNDAQAFFARLGYEPVERCAAPPEVQASAQFSSSCCCGATLMSKELEA